MNNAAISNFTPEIQESFSFIKTDSENLSNNSCDKLCNKPCDAIGRNMCNTIDRNNKNLEALLASFNSHKLADLDKANLMSRVDVKFVLPIAFLPELLQQVKKDYSILDINGKRISRYYNQYFDTQKMDFYQNHHNGKLNRFKVRSRTYLDTNTKFLEVKFKNNQKRTIKSRIKLSGSAENQNESLAFIQQKMGQSFTDLTISQQGGYQRIALANEAAAERLTLDFNLWYQLDENKIPIDLPGFFIAELKQNKRSKRSPFYQLMSKNALFPASFSKYCIGCALLYGKRIKQNQFKAMLSKINQLNCATQPNFYTSN